MAVYSRCCSSSVCSCVLPCLSVRISSPPVPTPACLTPPDSPALGFDPGPSLALPGSSAPRHRSPPVPDSALLYCPGNDSCPADSPAPGLDLRLPSTLLCSTALVTTPVRLTHLLLVSTSACPRLRSALLPLVSTIACPRLFARFREWVLTARLPGCFTAPWWIPTGSPELLTLSLFPQPLINYC